MCGKKPSEFFQLELETILICISAREKFNTTQTKSLIAFDLLLSYSDWQGVYPACMLSVLCWQFICTSQTGHEPGQPGTCPWTHGPQGWTPRGTWWPGQQACSERGAVKRAYSGINIMIMHKSVWHQIWRGQRTPN